MKFIKSLLSRERNEKENTGEHIQFITEGIEKKVMSPAKIWIICIKTALDIDDFKQKEVTPRSANEWSAVV